MIHRRVRDRPAQDRPPAAQLRGQGGPARLRRGGRWLPARLQRQRVPSDFGETVGTMLLACLLACLLAGGAAAASVLCSLQLGPGLGEILVFRPGSYIPPDWQIAARHVTDQRLCILSPAVMSAVRGSMVVERRLQDGWTYQVHWAGARTSDGSDTCGNVADLRLGRTEMQALVNAAGGGPADHWRFSGL